MSHPMVSCAVVFTATEAAAERLETAVAAILASDAYPTNVTTVMRGPSKRLYRIWVTRCRGLLGRVGIEHKIIEPDRPIRLGDAWNDGIFESKALWVICGNLSELEDVRALVRRIWEAPETGELLVARGGTPAFRWRLWADKAIKKCGSDGDRIPGTGGFGRFSVDPVSDFVAFLDESGVKKEMVP